MATTHHATTASRRLSGSSTVRTAAPYPPVRPASRVDAMDQSTQQLHRGTARRRTSDPPARRTALRPPAAAAPRDRTHMRSNSVPLLPYTMYLVNAQQALYYDRSIQNGLPPLPSLSSTATTRLPPMEPHRGVRLAPTLARTDANVSMSSIASSPSISSASTSSSALPAATMASLQFDYSTASAKSNVKSRWHRLATRVERRVDRVFAALHW